MNWPSPMTGNSPATNWLNHLLQAARSHSIKRGARYRLKIDADGTGLEMDDSFGGGQGLAQEYHLKSVQDDFLTCRTWDGTNEGSTDIYIAKQPKNRTSLLKATVYGVVHTYTYQPGPDAFNLQRTNNDGTKTETELITPAWIAGDKSICDIIYAIPSKVSALKNPNGGPVSLIEIGPYRQWAS